MNKYTAQGKTVEEAVSIALEALHIAKEDAQIEILDEGKKGFLGIGQRDAVVSVKKDTSKEDIIEQTLAESLIVDKRNHSEPEEKKTAAVSSETVTEEVEQQTETAKVSEEVVTNDDGATEEHTPEEMTAKDQQAIADVQEYITAIVRALDQNSQDVYVDVEQEDDYIYYDIHSEHPGIIIGRHGKVLEAIYTLAQIYLHNEAASKLYVEVDTENYRGRRENSLRHLAKKAAAEAVDQSQAVVLEGLTPKERKVIHRLLSHNKHVKTYSRGQASERSLVVEAIDSSEK